jgi:anti-sigma B factor antagonist
VYLVYKDWLGGITDIENDPRCAAKGRAARGESRLSPGRNARGHDNRGALGTPFACRLEECPRATVVHVAGEADLDAHQTLSAALTEALGLRKPIILDLNHLTYIDAHSIGFLLRHQQRAAAVTLRVVIANPSYIVRRVMDILALDSAIPVYSSIEAALQVVDGEGGRFDVGRELRDGSGAP